MLLSAVFPFFKPYITLCWPQSRLLQTPTWLYIEYILISEFKCFNLLFWGIAQNVRRTLCFPSTQTKVRRSPPFLHIFWWNRFSMKDNIFQHKIYPAEFPILTFFLNILKLKRNYFSKKKAKFEIPQDKSCMEKYYLSLKTGFIKKYEEIRTFVCAFGKQKVGGHFGGFPKTRLKH